MNILFTTSEASPFIKTGGLGDVAGSLPPILRQKGVDIRIVLPLYGCIAQEWQSQMKYVNHIYIDMAWRKQYCGIFTMEHQGCTWYFIDNKFYFNGHEPYGYLHEDVEKFAFFSKAVLSILPTVNFRPDLIHCNDWQTAAVPVYLDSFQDNPFYRDIKTVMTIHNLRFQGRWGLDGIKDVMGISPCYFTGDKLEFYSDANILKGGIVYADKITTVSNTYAHEITTPEYGEGLNGLLHARRNDLVGIVNGISYNEYNPETDPLIPFPYNKSNVFEQKKKNKHRLQEELNLERREDCFLIGIVSRLTDQKGFDLIGSQLEALCNDDNIQIVVLGTGDPQFENMFRYFAWKYPHKLSANIYFSNELAHKIYAGCDAFLMPSRFEPCGLSQLISLRYGTIPIVRETGGLKDTVIPYNEYTGEGTGFSFSNYSANDMYHVIDYAKSMYQNPDIWHNIMIVAMEQDFSWDVSALSYLDLYTELTHLPALEPLPTNIQEEAVIEEVFEDTHIKNKSINDKSKNKSSAKKKTTKSSKKKTKK